MDHFQVTRVRTEYQALLEQALVSLVEKLKVRPDVLRISVFGSYARGRADLFTDLDVLVIMETAMSFIERQRLVYELCALPVDLDLLCYTSQEFAAMKNRPFLRHALTSEKVLYEKKPA